MVNMITGEVNKITDNGRNFTTKVWVIPPNDLERVVADFPRPQ
jgi:hypothetical protein